MTTAELIEDLAALGFFGKLRDNRVYIKKQGRDCGYIDLSTGHLTRAKGAPRMSSERIVTIPGVK